MKTKVILMLMSGALMLTSHVQAGSVVVGKDSAASTMDAEAARKVFLGREQSVGSNRAVVIYQKSGATKDSFENDVLGRSGAELKAYWSKLAFTGRASAPQEVDNDAAVIAKVTSTPGAIGYVSDSAVNDSVKVLFKF